MLRKVFIILIGGIALAAIFLEFVFIPIPIATSDILNGEYIRAEDVKTQRMFFNEVPTNALRDVNEVVGQFAGADIVSGGVFMPYLLLSGTETPGVGQVTLDKDSVLLALVANANNIPASLKAGDTVSIVAYYKAGEAGAQPAFTISYPHYGKVQMIKKDEYGTIIGVDLITHISIGTELALASLQGIVSLQQVHPESTPITNGSNVNDQHNQYFFRPQID